MAGTVTDLGATLDVNGDWDYAQFTRGGGSETLVDCSGATWIIQQDGSLSGGANRYPVYLKDWQAELELRGGYAPGMSDAETTGGRVDGTLSLTRDWGSMYGDGNSAAVFTKACPAPHIKGWRIDRAWDGIRVTGGAVNDGWLVEDFWISRCRDDAFEQDEGWSGTLRNGLIEECFSGISLESGTSSDASSNVVNIQNVLCGMKGYNYRGEIDHAPPFKVGTTTPQCVITNCVFAISRADHFGYNTRLKTMFEQKVSASSSGNYFLNLSDNNLPGDYPAMPPSFTYLQGQAARDYWDAAVAEFHAGAAPAPDFSEAGTYNMVSMNPLSTAIYIETDEAYSVTVTVGATDGSRTGTETISLTVS